MGSMLYFAPNFSFHLDPGRIMIIAVPSCGILDYWLHALFMVKESICITIEIIAISGSHDR